MRKVQPEFRIPKKCRTLTIGYVLSLFCFQAFSQELVKFDFDENTGVTSTMEAISQTSFPITNHFARPERIAGIEGNALRLDGYSTWAYNNSFPITGITNKMTISVWYTTEAFNKESGAIISQLGSNAGFALEVEPYGNINFVFFADGTKYNIQTSQKLEKYKWNYIVATLDLENTKVRIIVNGNEWASKNLNPLNNLTLSSATMFLGRHNNDIKNAGFLLTSLNGAIDEIKLFNYIVPDTEIAANHAAHNSIIPNLTIDPEVRYADDYLRPKYHAMPNTCWTNEPYGLTFYNGKYHIFFQKNPNSPTLYFMHWGHLSSSDLVNWTEEKIALAPSPGFDCFGVWSGTTIKDASGTPQIIYTGVDGAKAGIGTASNIDPELIGWTKYINNPLIPSPPSGYQAMDFRDPFVWKSGNTYYMIVGSGIQNSGGGILFTYKSDDLINWVTISPLYRSVYVNESGYFWEMPFFFPLNNNNEYILGITPIPYQGKPAETLYWIGKWENEKFTPYKSSPQKMELINSLLLSPSINTDTSGNITYIGIIPEDRSANSQIQAEWRHIFSLPRVIRQLTDTSIGQIPHPNLCRLHGSLAQITNRVIQPGTGFNIPEFSGNQAALSLKVKADSASRFTVQVLKHADGHEFTSIIFDLSLNKIAFDRGHSSLSSDTPKDYRSSDYIFNFKDTINITVFIDHSVIEVFVDNLTVFSFRVYPSRQESQLVDLIVNKGKITVDMDAWQMKNMKDMNSSEVCEPEYLPARFRRIGDPLGMRELLKTGLTLKLYPNPASNKIRVESGENWSGNLNISISDMSGKTLLRLKKKAPVDSSCEIDISRLLPGEYLLNIEDKHKFGSAKFIVYRN